MAKKTELAMHTQAQTDKMLGKVKRVKSDFPKAAQPKAAVNRKIKSWAAGLKPEPTPRAKDTKVKAVMLDAKNLASLRAIHESTAPTAEAIVNQKMSESQINGVLFSSLTTFEYGRMESEYKRRLKRARTPAARAKVDAEWKQVVQAGIQAFGSAGLKVNERVLNAQAKALFRSNANLNAVAEIANSARDSAGSKLTAGTRAVAAIVPVTGVLALGDFTIIPIPGLCSKPFAEGSFTRHFGHSFSLSVRIKYWCPTWTNPFRTCTKTVTLASLSFSVDVSVGYRVTCCGAVVWGQASAQVCASVLGVSVCASCTARIVGVAGFGRTVSGGSCIYGIGVNAQLRCTFAGATVLNVQAPFGWNINGPCPPAGLC